MEITEQIYFQIKIIVLHIHTGACHKFVDGPHIGLSIVADASFALFAALVLITLVQNKDIVGRTMEREETSKASAGISILPLVGYLTHLSIVITTRLSLGTVSASNPPLPK